ncbi:hypothetical protein HPB50_007621 [Hyalomma asiaticum]|uniref:Uncharacterized protein n=1 Tax=Hyalomma asiaticum TaxID=266040 RepID=A0ACB7SEU8_HYAAI|nr:hypothetical protein HPB50_007621 [Hyalomma asiaticum]
MEMAAIMSEQPAFSAELLIDAIKQHPVLFDKSHPRYKEVEFKKELWMKIAADLGVTGFALAHTHPGGSDKCPGPLCIGSVIVVGGQGASRLPRGLRALHAARAVADGPPPVEADGHRQQLWHGPPELIPTYGTHSRPTAGGPMAVDEPHPGRQCRSVSFDDGKRRVIDTDLDPEVDPLKLKSIAGRVPTPRPSRTDCAASPPSEHGEGSRPPSAASQAILCSHDPAHMEWHKPYICELSNAYTAGSDRVVPATQGETTLSAELLMRRLTLECAGETNNERATDESVLRREHGEGMTEDAAATQLATNDPATNEGGGLTE